jgi:(p)ppGpp synthase/HD superfamily hydrolase
MSNLEHALVLAEAAHRGQKDRLGRPYLEHCRRVVEAVEKLDEKIVAYLHDIPEKAEGWTLERLAAEGFSPSIVAAVDAMTRREGEDDAAFVRRAAANRLARPVKRADLEDNLRQARMAGLPTGKYESGLRIVRDEFENS